MSSKLLPIAAAVIVLGGCSTMNKNIGQEDPGVGEAVKYNAAAQIINPDPVYRPGDAQAGDSGVKGAAAVKRYRSDAVKQVEVMQTTSGTSGTGGGSPR